MVYDLLLPDKTKMRTNVERVTVSVSASIETSPAWSLRLANVTELGSTSSDDFIKVVRSGGGRTATRDSDPGV